MLFQRIDSFYLLFIKYYKPEAACYGENTEYVLLGDMYEINISSILFALCSIAQLKKR